MLELGNQRNEKLSQLINEFKSAHSSKGALSFLRKSPEAYYIFLLIMQSYYQNKSLCVENLINQVTPKFCSRQTVKNITNNAVELNFLFKINDKADRRRKLFIPTNITIDEFNDWMNKSLKSF